MSEESFALRRAYKDPAAKEERLARIEETEQRVFERAAEVVEGVLAFKDVGFDQTEPPAEWIAMYGEEEAKKKLALARSGWLPASTAPAGFQVALRAMTGIARSRGYKVKVTQNNLNVKIALPAPTSAEHPGPVTYEVRELDP